MNKILIAIVVIVVAIAGWFVYQTQSQSALSAEPVFSASMSCDDGSRFVAEFASATSVNILVDGVVVRTLPRTSDAPQTYADNDYSYVFVGEEANVTTKATGKTTTCNQPQDPNNAPMNFGDAGEGGGVKQDTSLIVSESIVGTWQSTEDAKFVREFKDKAVVEDRYDNKVTSTGLWVAFTKDNAPKVVPFPIDPGAVYLQITTTGEQADTLDFKVAKLTPETLELIYMGRGGVLQFKRVQ